MTHSLSRTDAALAREARLLGQYALGGHEPPLDLPQRYAGAVRTLFPRQRRSASLLFALRNPWAIGALDGACALLQPQDALRQRLLLATALLEAQPAYADTHFLPRHRTLLPLLGVVGWNGVRAAAKVALGIPLLALLRLRRR